MNVNHTINIIPKYFLCSSLNLFNFNVAIYTFLLTLIVLLTIYHFIARKKLLQKINHSQDKLKHFQDLVESVNAIFWEANPENFQFNYISPQAKKLFGYSLQNWIENPSFWENHIHPEDRKNTVTYCQKFTRQKLPHQLEYRFRTQSGKYIWIKDLVEIIKQDDGSYKLVGIFIDISRQKAQEQVLQKMRTQISQAYTIIEQTQDPMMIKNLEGNYQFVNKATENFFGLPKRQILGKSDTQLLGEEISKKIRLAEKEAIDKNKIFTQEEELTLNDRNYYFETSYAPLWEQNSLSGIISISRDITERKKNDSKIRESEERFRRYFQEEKSVKLLIDSESGQITDANLSAEIFYGYDYKALTSLSIYDINVLPKEEVQKEISSASLKNKNHFNFKHRLSNGLIRHVEVYSTPIQVNEKNYLLSTIYDITNRVKTGLALRESEERYRFLTESAPMGIMVHSQGKIMYANPFALDLIEADTLESIIGYPIKDLIHPDYQELMLKRIRMLYQSDMMIAPALDEKCITVKGNEKDFLISGILVKYEGKTAVCNVFHDITERKVAEKELLQTRSFLQEAEQIAKIGTWIYDLINGELWWSEGLYQVFGRDEKQGIPPNGQSHQHPWQENIHIEDRQKVINALYKSLEIGEYQCEYRFYRYDNRELIYVYTEADIEFDKNKNPIRIIGIVQDISERKRGELELLKKRDQLEKANQELEELNYIASHDLKAPIANMQGLLELYNLLSLEEKPELILKMEKTVQKMKATLSNLNEVISLKKSLAETKKNIYFDDILNQIIASIDTQIKTTDTQIVSDFSLCSTINYPPVQLESILQNLLTNAIKYRRPEHRPEIHIKTEKTKKGVCLSVSDNGLGMDLDKMRDKLFKIFHRFHDHVEGKGIGLYIINQIVQSHGGWVDVKSEINKGTTFKIILNNE